MAPGRLGRLYAVDQRSTITDIYAWPPMYRTRVRQYPYRNRSVAHTCSHPRPRARCAACLWRIHRLRSVVRGSPLRAKGSSWFGGSKVPGRLSAPYHFKGGVKSKCFRILEANGFAIITKGETHPFPDEVSETAAHTEGSVQRVFVNRYERDPEARAKAIRHHGLHCHACGFDFKTTYGVAAR